nr:MAG TPA: hypothetical protein [Caudoviricetes sp.]
MQCCFLLLVCSFVMVFCRVTYCFYLCTIIR